MKSIYHPRGVWRAGCGPVWHHFRRWVEDPAYRALHRFHGQLRRLPRCTAAAVRFGRRPICLCDGPSFLSAWDEVFVNRIYDVGPLPPQPRLVDAGANIGLAALYWRWRYGPVRYLGFEPDPGIAAVCRENLVAWGVGGELVEAGVGPRAGQAAFVRDGADGGHTVDLGTGVPRAAIQVRIEELVPRIDGPVDLLKIDIEGGERELLPALSPVVGRIGRLFVEWHCPPSGPSGLGAAVELMEGWGFTVLVQAVAWSERPLAPDNDGPAAGQQLNLFAVRR